MCHFSCASRSWLPVGVVASLFSLIAMAASAQIRDGGIDPYNLGKGDWIYILANAVNRLGGNAPAVTNLSSLMAYEKNLGVKYLIIKAGDGGNRFPNDANPQFTSEVVNAGHAAGLWIFGYNRSFGTNIPGEQAISDYVFNQGADGFVFDAEIEWESQNLPNNTMLATQLCAGVRASWPNKFLAHSPFAFISVHGSFPYREFGYYCDVAMPQDYWVEFGYTPTATVTRMDTDWRNWQNGLSGKWTNAIKPIVPVGQGWSGSGTVTAAQITEFVNALKNDASPATRGGYKGVNYWRAELHPAEVLDAIRTNNIGDVPTHAPVVTNVSVATVSDVSATFTWTTDQSSDSVIEYGLDRGYGSAATNTTRLYYHTLTISGLSPNTTYHFRANSRNAANQQGSSSDYVFTTLTAPVPDIILDNPQASFSGSWSLGTSSLDKYGADYNYCTAVSGAATRSATYRPTIVAAGKYNVYAWYPQGSNRSTNAPHLVSYTGGTVTTYLNQTANGGTWRLIASAKDFASGTNGYVQILNNTGEGGLGKNVMADAIRFAFVPPPPAAPTIATQPQNQTVNQGNSATFTVVASGTAPLAYQWRREGEDVSGATTSSFTRNNVQAADAGNYSVVVTNSVGRTTSSNALLTVNVPPTITNQPQSQTVSSGTDVTFSVGATGTPPLGYQWRFNDAEISGATASAYTRTNVQSAAAGAYSVIVSNVAGSVTSADALLSIVPSVLLHIDSVSLVPDQGWQLQVSGGPGDFAIEAAPALGNWTQLTTLTATSSVFQFIDTQTNQAMRFYRVRMLP